MFHNALSLHLDIHLTCAFHFLAASNPRFYCARASCFMKRDSFPIAVSHLACSTARLLSRSIYASPRISPLPRVWSVLLSDQPISPAVYALHFDIITDWTMGRTLAPHRLPSNNVKLDLFLHTLPHFLSLHVHVPRNTCRVV